jgi:signal transduction histidine kinase
MPTRLLGRLADHPVLRRRTLRLRITALYGVPFLLSGAALLALTNLLARSGSATAVYPVHAGADPGVAAALAQIQEHAANQQAADLHQLLVGSTIALAVMALVSIVLGWVVAGRLLRPLRAMTVTAQRISHDRLHERLAVPGPGDELKDLGDTIDDLLERLEAAFSAQGRFVANASHELRTPLATMRASLDVAVAKPGPVPPQTISLAARLRRELDQVDELLEGLLVLARAQHGVPSGRAVVSLDDLVSTALADRAGAIAAKDLKVTRAGAGAARVEGSRVLLRRLVDNVVDNAVRHNEEGGWIRLATATAGGTARLTIESGGAVLDQDQVQQLAQPFRRLGADRTGSDRGAGLGLSIVAAIAEAHGGTLGLHAGADGGLRVDVELPLAAGAAAASVAAP